MARPAADRTGDAPAAPGGGNRGDLPRLEGTYGSPKVFIELVRRGWRVSVNTVAKLMAELGLAGRKVKRRRSLTRPGRRPAAPDFVRRDFTAEEPDLVWAGDMTEIDTGEGKFYLATVIDLFSRRLLGYAMGARHDAGLWWPHSTWPRPPGAATSAA
ncbi:IS3 family transposase [Streptomyces sp. NPDC001292]|uniref:IS3 family transposase n=1 Tax=Streptomyces sp. NPDC001292 TaxID=3364558 RepID=UPI0036962318